MAQAETGELVRRLALDGASGPPEALLGLEWLVTNGLGGYAAGTLLGVDTRRYHGLLVAALPAPLGRMVMLSHLVERLRLPDRRVVWLGGEERAGGVLELEGARHLVEFRLEAGLPVWRYDVDGHVVEKRLLLPYRQNSVYVSYQLLAGEGAVRLGLRPSVAFRPHEEAVTFVPRDRPVLTAIDDQYEVSVGREVPPLRMLLYGPRSAFTSDPGRLDHVLYRVEQHRGYEARGSLWSPGYFRVDLAGEQTVTLVASTEPWETIRALRPGAALATERARRQRLLELAPPIARVGPAAELVLAADQFVITPAGRVEDAARALAAGDEVRSVIAGYHWFTDWGRDAMIALEGLTLVTGRHREAGHILRTFGLHVRDGLIPNMFPEGDREGLYHTADATLWFFHAIDRHLRATEDRHTLADLLPTLRDIVARHLEGTRFGIHMDPRDGLLVQGAEGYQLTWMDAKVGDWVVTPRRGKAVEINALWYNALCLLAGWLLEAGDGREAERIEALAGRARAAFNARFWYAGGGHLYDVVDGESGDDAACRPNQILAISLAHPVLDEGRWRPVLDAVRRHLLTPVGLRSLSPAHPEYQARYDGDLRARDAAYHQGTVWAWLIGPFVDAWLKCHPGERVEARALLRGFVPHLGEACVGSLSEIFDAEPPFTPRGCVAQAWSVAEVLRTWVRVADEDRAPPAA